MRARLARLFALVCGLVCVLAWGPGALAAQEKVSVIVFGAEGLKPALERSAQARAEEVLSAAGMEVLDDKQAAKLKKNWVNLADPGHIVTAEEFAARAGQFDIGRVFRIALSASATSVHGAFYTASATADLRVIDRAAKVDAKASVPMGTRGLPPSDGLTEGAALVNAVQRAVDDALARAGVDVPAPVLARAVPLRLVEVPAPIGAVVARPDGAELPVRPDWVQVAVMIKQNWSGEEPACVNRSPDGHVGVVGGYTWAISRLGGLSRSYGGRVHLIDIDQTAEFNVMTVHETGKRGAGEDGSSAPLACRFLGNWRYLLVASGNKLVCLDVERGVETCSHRIEGGASQVQIDVVDVPGQGSQVVLEADGRRRLFNIVTK